MRHLTILLLLFAVQSICTAQPPTPKKVIVDGGAAPTLISQLTNDLNYADEAYVDSVAAAVRNDITSYSWTVAGDNASSNQVSDGENILISGGSGLQSSLIGQTLRIDYNWPELGSDNSPSVFDFLITYNSTDGYQRTEIGDLPFATSFNFNVATDEISTFLSIGSNSVLDIAGGTGIETEISGGDVVINLAPNEVSARSASSSDYVLTFTSGALGKTQISALPISASSSYDWVARTDDGNTNTVVNGEILDFDSGVGLRSVMVSGNLSYALELTGLTNTNSPSGSYYVPIFNSTGSTYLKTQIDDILAGVSSGTGDITGVTAGQGLSGGGLSGSVTLDLDIEDVTLTTTIGRGTDELAVHSNTYDQTRRIAFHDLLGDVIVPGSGITFTKSVDQRTFTISSTASGGTGDITAVNAGDHLTGGGTSGSVTLNVDEGDVYEALIDEGEFTSSSDQSTAFVGNDFRELVWMVQANSSNTTMTLPDPDFAPYGAQIHIYAQTGASTSVVLDVTGSTSELFWSDNENNIVGIVNSVSVQSGEYHLRRVPNPFGSGHVWHFLRR